MGGALILLSSLLPGVARAAGQADLVVYPVVKRRAGRVIWLCEELGLPYVLAFPPGDAAGLAKLHESLMKTTSMVPTVTYRGQVLYEPGAILELLLDRVGHGRLVPPMNSSDFAHYLQWMHFAEGTGMYRIFAQHFAATVAKIPLAEVPQGLAAGQRSGLVAVEAVLGFMEDFLGKHPYFGGDTFTGADIMMYPVAEYSGPIGGVDSARYPHVAAWEHVVAGRPAFKRAEALFET